MMHTSLAGAGVPLPGGDVAANHFPSVVPIRQRHSVNIVPLPFQLRVLPQIAGESFIRSRSTRCYAPIGVIKDTDGVASLEPPHTGPRQRQRFSPHRRLSGRLWRDRPHLHVFARRTHGHSPRPPGSPCVAEPIPKQDHSVSLDSPSFRRPLMQGRTACRHTCAFASRRSATSFGAVGEICLVSRELLHRPQPVGFYCFSRGRTHPLCPAFPRLPGIILRSNSIPTRFRIAPSTRRSGSDVIGPPTHSKKSNKK
jgi:hypothetical protein